MIRQSLLVLAAFGLLLSAEPLASQSDNSAFLAPEPLTGCASAPFATGQGQQIDAANFDRSVAPCDNFFQFADGGWIKANPIPAAYSRWGTFNILQEHNQDVLRGILEDAAKDRSSKLGSNWQKIGDFYATCMDEDQIEAAGVKPLQAEFDRIAAVHDSASLQQEIAELNRKEMGVLFGFGPQQDFKDSTREIAMARQGGLGLPDRDYYLRDDDKSKQTRDAYLKHVANMFQLLGDDQAMSAAEAKTVMDIETSLAKATMKRVDLRDPDKIYHMTTVADLRALAPNLDWDGYFKGVGAPAISSLNVAQPDFFKEVSAEMAAVPVNDWKTYMRWHVIHASAQSLSKKFVDENFDFYGRTLTGAKELRPRWRRCVQFTDGELGEALGQYYVEKAFPPAAKAKALALVHNLTAALRDDLKTLEWMSPQTRQKAIEKLDAITPHIGYPDKWRDYSKFEVTRTSYLENVIRGDEFEHAFEMSKIGKPVDRTEWGMTPPTVNAYYNPTMNEIVFPAGILQPPFYDPNRDDAMNYGGIGVVIGHEMTHGFDDSGAKFDGQGNLKNWWTPEDLKNFTARGDCIAKQFDGFEVETGLHENGKLVEGESIADLGGLAISLAAYHHSVEAKPAPPDIDGFSPDQRFFLGYALIWAESDRPEVARLGANTDPHPLAKFRVNGPLSNMAAFAKTWNCSAGSPMVRPEDQRCRIW
jgi:putative endopeptidase